MVQKKSEVFAKFRQWKVMVEKSSGAKLKTLRSDDGVEHVSTEFEDCLNLKEQDMTVVFQRHLSKMEQRKGSIAL